MLKFNKLKVKGAYLIDQEEFPDERGFFSRTFCTREFAQMGLNPHVAQCNGSFSRKAGTLRGLHYQIAPHEEAKLVRCTRGACHDVIVDLRRNSPTYLKWDGAELTALNRQMIYVPEGCAHGLITLVDETEMWYQMSTLYAPASARGMRWNDPAVNIQWMMQPMIISEKDKSWEFLRI
ncbi:MAG TPA: dTDP-4-dehydrorhamnose 3,5-epimerase [Phycisphaerales bacterium]|nr:dTDP-4-dehydrorhamnose 3,5-epimerase [Phycisphaerales bacterium]